MRLVKVYGRKDNKNRKEKRCIRYELEQKHIKQFDKNSIVIDVNNPMNNKYMDIVNNAEKCRNRVIKKTTFKVIYNVL